MTGVFDFVMICRARVSQWVSFVSALVIRYCIGILCFFFSLLPLVSVFFLCAILSLLLPFACRAYISHPFAESSGINANVSAPIKYVCVSLFCSDA